MHHCASLRGPAQQVLAGCRLVQVYKIILPSLWPFFKQQNKQKKQSKLKTVTFPVGRQVYGSLPSWPSKSLAVAEAAERCRGVTRRAAEEGLRCAAGGGAAFRSSALRSAHTRGEGAPIPSTWSAAPYMALNE